MTKYFVSSDIHGFYDEWMESLNKTGFDKNNPDHKIIVCGDLFDRGNQPKEIINFINDMGDKIILIKGNHEDLMEDLVARNYANSYDYSNGTVHTLYDLSPEMFTNNVHSKIISDKTGLTNIIKRCYNYYETDHYIFVHGFIPVCGMDTKEYRYMKTWRQATQDEWKQARWLSCVEMLKRDIHEPNKTIVCGHWHCSALWAYKYPDKYKEFVKPYNFNPFISDTIIGIDGCTVFSKQVNVLIIEDTGGTLCHHL